MVNKSR